MSKGYDLTTMSPERAHEVRSLGGKASAEVRRSRINFRNAARLILETDLTDDDEVRLTLERRNLPCDEQMAILLAATNKAKMGDIEAARFLRDSSGQKPTDSVALQASITDKPLDQIDLSALSNDELAALAAEWGFDNEASHDS